MKEFTLNVLFVLSIPYSVISFVLIFMGIFAHTLTFSKPCEKPLSRVEYVFPAFQVGCWLGEVPGDSK